MSKKAPTKQRILAAALTLFSERGYDAVSVGDIADSVGIRAPSLYKHYKSKEDIFEAVLEEMAPRNRTWQAALRMSGAIPAGGARSLRLMDEERLVQTGKELFSYFLHDEYACKFRRLLMLEQNRSPHLAALFAMQYLEEPLSYLSTMFGALADEGYLISASPHTMAEQFYAPIFMFLTLCDCLPETEPEGLTLLENNIR